MGVVDGGAVDARNYVSTQQQQLAKAHAAAAAASTTRATHLSMMAVGRLYSAAVRRRTTNAVRGCRRPPPHVATLDPLLLLDPERVAMEGVETARYTVPCIVTCKW